MATVCKNKGPRFRRASLVMVVALLTGSCGGTDENPGVAVSPQRVGANPPSLIDLNGVWLQVQDRNRLGLLVEFRLSSFAIDDRGEFGTNPAAQGRYGLEDDSITFTSQGSDQCPDGDTWAWQAELVEDGHIRAVHTEESEGNCAVQKGTEWTLLRVTPRPHAAIRELAPSASAEGRVPTAEELYGIWSSLESPGMLIRLSADGSFGVDASGYVAPDADASVLGDYELVGNRIRFAIGGGHACLSNDGWVWNASLLQDGLLRIVHSKEASGNCRVEKGTEWTLIRLSPSSAASEEITPVKTDP
jgi:hypothetical protein